MTIETSLLLSLSSPLACFVSIVDVHKLLRTHARLMFATLSIMYLCILILFAESSACTDAA